MSGMIASTTRARSRGPAHRQFPDNSCRWPKKSGYLIETGECGKLKFRDLFHQRRSFFFLQETQMFKFAALVTLTGTLFFAADIQQTRAQVAVAWYAPAPAVGVVPVRYGLLGLRRGYAPVVVGTAPVPLSAYYAPAPVTSYYAPAPVTTLYAPATPVSAWYAPTPLPVTTWYAPPVYMGR
jgi:hypothetical protein